MEERVKLPSSGYTELTKIIAGYSKLDREASLEDVSKLVGVGPTVVSGNNGFLLGVGIIEGGNKKKITVTGKRLGLAIEHDREDDVNAHWRISAQETITLLDIEAHRDDLKDTLINLATFSGALKAGAGGSYLRDHDSVPDIFARLAENSADVASSEYKIRTMLGAAAPIVNHANVIVPLGSALRFAMADQAREAILHAGNAIDSFLDDHAKLAGVSLAGATGINSKLDKLQAAGLPKKLVFNGKYLGHVRNAADHGVDPAIGVAWDITAQTGRNYVLVSCSFIAAMTGITAGAYRI